MYGFCAFGWFRSLTNNRDRVHFDLSLFITRKWQFHISFGYHNKIDGCEITDK